MTLIRNAVRDAKFYGRSKDEDAECTCSQSPKDGVWVNPSCPIHNKKEDGK
jgi:hypothetical protein